MNPVVGSGNRLMEGTGPQYWYTVRCRPGCRNEGPWMVYGPSLDQYHCARCHREMTVDPS
jgi:hypothetical protein